MRSLKGYFSGHTSLWSVKPTSRGEALASHSERGMFVHDDGVTLTLMRFLCSSLDHIVATVDSAIAPSTRTIRVVLPFRSSRRGCLPRGARRETHPDLGSNDEQRGIVPLGRPAQLSRHPERTGLRHVIPHPLSARQHGAPTRAV